MLAERRRLGIDKWEEWEGILHTVPLPPNVIRD